MALSSFNIPKWSFQRWLYVLIGGTLLVYSLVDFSWLGIILSGWFVTMGLAGFGCASGNCCKR